MRFKMTWEKIKKELNELTKRNEEVCRQKPSRRQFADAFLDKSLRALATDCVGMPYGKNQDNFNRCLSNITNEYGVLRETPPDEFNPNKTKNTEHALGKWAEWLDSIPKSESFWKKVRQFFIRH